MSEKDSNPMSKEDLLAKIRKDRADFSALWKGLTAAQLTQRPGPQSDWSLKDLIAHIVWWENLMIGNLIAVKEGNASTMIYDIDARNEETFRTNQERPLADVLDDFNQNLVEIEKHIEALTEEQINTAQLPKYPLLKHIIGDTSGHYAMHFADVEAYVQSLHD